MQAGVGGEVEQRARCVAPSEDGGRSGVGWDVGITPLRRL